jgi:hypothetical protein
MFFDQKLKVIESLTGSAVCLRPYVSYARNMGAARLLLCIISCAARQENKIELARRQRAAAAISY